MLTSLTQLEVFAAQGQKEAAQRLLREWQTEGIRDARLHLRLADLCEELGLTEELLTELRLACRDEPDNLETLKRLAQVWLDCGRTAKGVALLRRVIETDPSDVEAWEELGAALADQGQLEEARDVYHRAALATGRASFESRARIVRPEEAPEPTGAFSEAVVARFLRLFSGREGVYARQWRDTQGTGYSPVREPFNEKVVRNHLLANDTIGVYVVRQDQTVNFMAVDLDLSKPLVRSSSPADPAWQQSMQALHEYGERLRGLADLHGLPGYLEDSGYKGRHLWFFFEEPLPARQARHFGRHLLAHGGPLPENVSCEVFPRQSYCPPDQLGNLIKLPLAPHKATGLRGLFLDDKGRAATDQDAFLLSIKTVTAEMVQAFLEDAELAEDEPLDLEEEPAARLPAAEQYDPAKDPDYQILLARCHTLRALTEAIAERGEVTHEQARVVTYTVGHLPQGAQAVNSCLRRCAGLDRTALLKSRLRSKPMGCGRIRQLVPDVAASVPCDCQFPESVGVHPHPLLHLRCGPPGDPELEALLLAFLRAREALGAWLTSRGVNEVTTASGQVKLVEGTITVESADVGSVSD